MSSFSKLESESSIFYINKDNYPCRRCRRKVAKNDTTDSKRNIPLEAFNHHIFKICRSLFLTVCAADGCFIIADLVHSQKLVSLFSVAPYRQIPITPERTFQFIPWRRGSPVPNKNGLESWSNQVLYSYLVGGLITHGSSKLQVAASIASPVVGQGCYVKSSPSGPIRRNSPPSAYSN
ncbi:hypothetical protein TNCV_195011 [Trichonephila clavipes]|uniref:Uncharacterized protein n=1 Tax=Trichonephila clavipes TaxID=2585209 RepID=A0A8X6WI00_TRICX|nr:hypothetical protein TNCV_195011 [Trichonephila clavipes]